MSFLQIGILPGFPSNTYNSNVVGVKTGQPCSTGIGRVYGLEASWIISGTAHIRGIQACWIYCDNRQFDGIQSSFVVNRNLAGFNGIQATLGVNYAEGINRGLQAGALNISGDIYGFQPAATVNVSGNVTGMQAAVILNHSKDLTGFQTGLLNFADRSCGFQLGLINCAKEKGFQFGLINYIEDGVCPFLPFVNFSW